MERLFRQQLLKLPFAAALMIAVAGMPLEIYNYHQRGVGVAHAEPWLRRSASAIRAGVFAIAAVVRGALGSLQFWKLAVPITAGLLIATGVIDIGPSSDLLAFPVAGITIDELLTQKREKITAANELRDRVYSQQNSEWRGDDEAKFDGLMSDVEKITAQIDRLAKLDAAERSMEAAERPNERRSAVVPPESRGRRVVGQPSVEDRALAIHGWYAAGSALGHELVTERHHEAAARCGVNLNSKNLRFRLAPEALRSTQAPDVREWEQRLTQVDVVSPDLGGHYTVPDAMMRPLEMALLQYGAMRQVAEIIRTATGAELPTPTMNDTANEGAIVGEGLEHADLDTEFSQLTMGSFLYSSKKVPVSWQYLQDNAINFVGKIGSILGERIGRITNRHFTVGNGTTQPNGIVTAATSSGVTTASATAITYDELIDLVHSVDPAYRAQGARFMFSDTTLKLLKKIKIPQFSGDTSGQPLWRPGMAAGVPDTIDGYEYVINQHMAAPTATQKAVLFGLLSKYQIRDVRDITLVRLDERYAELGVVAFLSFSRHDGDLLDAGTHPVKYLTMHS